MYCQLGSIKKCLSPNDVRRTLSSLPKSLHETYARILSRIEDEEQLQRAVTVLQCLCFSTRPLHLSELIEFLAIDFESSGEFSPDERLADPKDITTICSSLITLNEVEDRTRFPPARFVEVKLAHSSVQEYLLSRRNSYASQFTADSAHFFLARLCIIYLLDVCNTQAPLTRAIFDDRPLALYSAANWWRHLKEAPRARSEDLMLSAGSIMSTQSNLMTWVQLYDPDLTHNRTMIGRPLESFVPALYYASLLGFPRIVEQLLNEGSDPNASDGLHGYALQAAAFEGHGDIVQILLESGANIDARGGTYYTALQAASFEGHEEVVKMLLERGAGVDAQGGRCGNALMAASFRGHFKVAQMLLDGGADVNFQNDGWGSALQAASAEDHPDIVHMLLSKGANVNAHRGIFGSALLVGSVMGSERIVKMLLDKGADVNGGRTDLDSPLHAASKRGHRSVAQMLQSKGALDRRHQLKIKIGAI